MRLGELPGFRSLPVRQQQVIASHARQVRLPAGAPVTLAGLPADVTWVLLDGELLELPSASGRGAVLSPPTVLAADPGTRWSRSVYCRGPGHLLAVPLRRLGRAPALAARVERALETTVAPHDIELSVGWLREAAPDRVLEVGAGAGLYSRFLLGVCGHLTVSDPSTDALRAAEERLGWVQPEGVVVETIRCAGERLTVDSASCDAVATRMAIHHMSAPPAFAAEAARVLRPGGVLVATDLLAPDRATGELLDERERRLDPTHRRILTRPDVEDALVRAGFEVEGWTGTSIRTSLRDLAARGGNVRTDPVEEWLSGLDGGASAVLDLTRTPDGDFEWTDRRFVVLARRGQAT